ncbi:hypothetical protein QTP86_032329 [Hemibagrus guttatus]|nr:hypothetical protein QTP86_032329 [Hemibagrus guttatus]
MKRRSKEKSQEKAGSRLLNIQENEKVEDLLGRRCVSLCTTVVQLFMALPHSPNSWSLQQTGVLCFVKDNPQRSYFIRLYNITAGKLVWEQELINQLIYNRSRPFFHTFQADDCQVGLNFANEEEAENFFSIVDEKINQRSKNLAKHQGKGHTFSQDDALPPLPPNGFGSQNLLPLGNIENQAPPAKSKKEKKEKDKKSKKKSSKLSKALIGAPSGFTHVGHLGMDNNSMDPDLMKLLSRAGISEADMRDSETSQLIYDVIERSGGMEAVKMELNRNERPLPPPPGVRRTSLPPVPSASSLAPSQARLGPLPPPPGGTTSTGTRSASVRSLPPTPSGGHTGTLPPPPVAQGGRRGPSARSGPLPPVPGGHSGSLPPPPVDRGVPPSSNFPHGGPLPPLPKRGSGPAPPPPGQRSAPPRPASRNESAPMPSGHSAGSFPPLPGRRTGSLPQPPNDECYLLPPPTLPEDFPEEFSDMTPQYNEDLPPPPLPFQSFPPPPVDDTPTSNMVPYRPSAISSGGGPPPPPPPPPPPAAPAPNLGGGPPPPKPSSGGGGRGALLDQIRIGTKLKTVTATPDPPPSAAVDSGDGIVGALMMVMQKRSKVIHSSDEGDEFDDDDDEDDEWD